MDTMQRPIFILLASLAVCVLQGLDAYSLEKMKDRSKRSAVVMPFKNDRGVDDEDLDKSQKSMFRPAKKRSKRSAVVMPFKNDRGVDDEDLDKSQKSMFRPAKNRTRRSVILEEEMWRWPKNTVYYKFETRDVSRISGISLVAEEYMAKTCLTFKEVSGSNQPHILIQDVSNDGCHSALGYVAGLKQSRGVQKLNLGTGCNTLGVMRHELQHALGVIHQQQAPDRDKFIRLLRQNMKRGMEPQFDYIKQGNGNYEGTHYDFRSNMHYAANSFSKDRNKLNTMEAIDRKWQEFIDNRKNPKLSFMDLKTLNLAYKCAPARCAKNPCSGYIDKNCKCIQDTDEMFGGLPEHPKWPPSADPRGRPSLNVQLINQVASGDLSVLRARSDIPGQGFLPNAGPKFKRGKDDIKIYFIKGSTPPTFITALSGKPVAEGLFLDDFYFDPNDVRNLGKGQITGKGDQYGRIWMFFVDPSFKPKKCENCK